MTTQNTAPLPTIVITPAKAAVSERGGSMDVLIRIQAPDQPEDQALRYIPKRLSLVIDRSGSMHGEPLTEALRCASHIASRMTAADELSVVVYDSHVETLVPLAPVTSTHSITDRLAGVQSGGNTALFDGWESGAQSLEGGKGDAISRVILLSDGQANVGLTRRAKLHRIAPSGWLRG
jgi:Ca-activated chloride channel family protein